MLRTGSLTAEWRVDRRDESGHREADVVFQVPDDTRTRTLVLLLLFCSNGRVQILAFHLSSPTSNVKATEVRFLVTSLSLYVTQKCQGAGRGRGSRKIQQKVHFHGIKSRVSEAQRAVERPGCHQSWLRTSDAVSRGSFCNKRVQCSLNNSTVRWIHYWLDFFTGGIDLRF